MDYEKEWKRAFDEASVIHQAGNKDVKQIIEQIFPLLNESERMREFLHHVFTVQYLCKDKLGKWHGEPVTNILAWLEKQGEEKPTQKLSKEQEYILNRIVEYLEDNDCPSEWKELLLDIHNAPYTEQKPHLELKAGKWYICHKAYCCRADHLTVKEGERFLCGKDGVVKGFVIKEPEKYFKETCAPAPIEDKQEPTDEVEHKFSEGDWIICKSFGDVQQIKEFTSDDKVWFDSGQGTFKEFLKGYRPWAIQDAKDGDVLISANNQPFIFNGKFDVYSMGGYCGLVALGYFALGEKDGYHWTNNNGIRPATQVEKNRLFSKMKEAGYVWDADKKEVRKIEQKPTEWSDEDKRKLSRIFSILNQAADEHAFSTTCRLIGDKECVELQDWLKKLMEDLKKPIKE